MGWDGLEQDVLMQNSLSPGLSPAGGRTVEVAGVNADVMSISPIQDLAA